MGDLLQFQRPEKLQPGQRPPRKSWLAERTGAERLRDLARQEANGPVNYCQFGDGDLYAIKPGGSSDLIKYAKQGEPQPKGVA